MRLLILLPHGKISRFYLKGFARAARQLKLDYLTWELAPIRQQVIENPATLFETVIELAKKEHIGAVLGYAQNPIFVVTHEGTKKNIFDVLGIPVFLFWTDQPQWNIDFTKVSADTLKMLSSANCHHFLKSNAAADEVHRVLGWKNCYGLPVAADPSFLKPQNEIEPKYDLVSIIGDNCIFPEPLRQFIDHENPDYNAIMSLVKKEVLGHLQEIWKTKVDGTLRSEFVELGRQWITLCEKEPMTAPYRFLLKLNDEFVNAIDWLITHPKTYFNVIHVLWSLRGWERSFIMNYLKKHFNCHIFGLSSSGVFDKKEWVNYYDQSAIYAQGRIAFNVLGGHEEEALSHKPFQIVASGVPMVHSDNKSLRECFEVGTEVEVFKTPQEARDIIASLLADPSRCKEMAYLARKRLLEEHTWKNRLADMFELAGISIKDFKK